MASVAVANSLDCHEFSATTPTQQHYLIKHEGKHVCGCSEGGCWAIWIQTRALMTHRSFALDSLHDNPMSLLFVQTYSLYEDVRAAERRRDICPSWERASYYKHSKWQPKQETVWSIACLVQPTSNTSPKLPCPTSRWILRECASTEVPSVLLVPTAVEPVPACTDTMRRAFKQGLRFAHVSVEYTRLAAYTWPTIMAHTAQGVRRVSTAPKAGSTKKLSRT